MKIWKVHELLVAFWGSFHAVGIGSTLVGEGEDKTLGGPAWRIAMTSLLGSLR